MWKATNKKTGVQYPLSDDQKAYYESSPHLKDKYDFEQVASESTKKAPDPVGEKKAA